MLALDIDIDRLLTCISAHGLAAAWKRLQIGWRSWKRLLEMHPTLGTDVAEAERYHLERVAARAATVMHGAADEFQLKKAKLRLEHARWLLERRSPDRYSSRLQVDVSVAFDLRVAVEEARERVEAITITPVSDVARRLIG